MARVALDSSLASLYQERKRAMEEYERLDEEFRREMAGTCRLARARKGLTQAALASASGLGRGGYVTVSFFERACRNGCGIEAAEKILRALGVRFR